MIHSDLNCIYWATVLVLIYQYSVFTTGYITSVVNTMSQVPELELYFKRYYAIFISVHKLQKRVQEGWTGSCSVMTAQPVYTNSTILV